MAAQTVQATTSTIPALKRELMEKLRARTGLSGVQVSWGFPTTPTKEMLVLGDVPDGEQEVAALRAGRHPRNEAYGLEVLIWAERGGNDQRAATERAFAIVGELEDALRDDPNVNGVVRSAQVGGPFSLEERVNPDGAACLALVTVTVSVMARLD